MVIYYFSLFIVAFLAALKRSTGFIILQRQQHHQERSDQHYRAARIRWKAAAADDQCQPPGEDAVASIKVNKIKPDILQPFLPALDPNYRNIGPIGQGEFVVSRDIGGPTLKELTNENILKIVLIQCSDLEVNTLVWKCLGYRFQNGVWTADECFPNWKERFPEPPDLIGMQRIYSPEVDKPSLKANQALVRSIPVDNKQSLKLHLKPLGWKGYQYAELTPNKTRRAQCANWLVFFREELFGYTVEELREKRKRRNEQAEAAKKEKQDEEWKPPVTEVF